MQLIVLEDKQEYIMYSIHDGMAATQESWGQTEKAGKRAICDTGAL